MANSGRSIEIQASGMVTESSSEFLIDYAPRDAPKLIKMTCL